MRHIMLSVTLLLLCLPPRHLAAQEPHFVYPRPAPEAFVVQRDVPFAGPLRLDFYRPAGDAVVPVVVFVNGVGSPTFKDWPGYRGWGEVTAARGLAAVLYQSAPGREREGLDQVVAWLRAGAPRLGVDAERLVLWSSSANVRTGLPAAMEDGRQDVAGAVVYYGDADVAAFRLDVPVLLVRAGLDGTELNARVDALSGRALAANAPWTIVSFGSGLHAFDIFNDDDLSRDVIDRTLDFMTRVTDPKLIRRARAAAGEAALGSAFARGDWPVAVAGYRARVAAHPDEAESQRRLGLSLLAAGDPAAALPALEAAHRLGRSGTRDTVVPAAEAAARSGNVPRALHWLELALASRFGPSVDEVRTGERFAGVRDAPEIVALLADLDAERKVQAMLEAGDGAAALEVLANAGGRLAREGVRIELAYRLLRGGYPLQAVAVFELAARLHPDSANAWESLSEGLEAAGEGPQALAAARRALELVAADPRLDARSREPIERAARDRVARLAAQNR